jgi:hypothetical protein
MRYTSLYLLPRLRPGKKSRETLLDGIPGPLHNVVMRVPPLSIGASDAEGAGDALSRPLAQKYRLFFSAMAYSMPYREHRMLNPVALHVIQRLHSVIPRPHR